MLAGSDPAIALVFLANAGIEFGGALAVDGGLEFRDLITQGDSSQASYAIMTDGIQHYSEVLNKSDLGNITEGIAKVGSDILIEPTIMTFSGKGDGLLSYARYANTSPVFGPFISYSLQNPDHFRETVSDMKGLYNNTADFVANFPQLVPASVEMSADIGIGTIQQGVEMMLGDEVAAQSEIFAIRAESYVDQLLRPPEFKMSQRSGITYSPQVIMNGIFGDAQL